MKIRSARDFGLLIRTRRKELGYTQAQLAQRCGCGVRFISELENGKPSVQLDKAYRVGTRIGINFSAEIRG